MSTEETKVTSTSENAVTAGAAQQSSEQTSKRRGVLDRLNSELKKEMRRQRNSDNRELRRQYQFKDDALIQNAPLAVSIAMNEYRKQIGRSISVTFLTCDKDGNLLTEDAEGIKLMLTANTMKKANASYSTPTAEMLLATELSLTIGEVDDESRTVYFNAPKTQAENSRARYAIISNLRRRLEQKQHPVVIGRILKVGTDAAQVDILCSDVRGVIYKNDLTHGYVRSARAIIAEGELCEFEVIKEKKTSYSRGPVFRLSRKNLVEDPWKKIPTSIAENSSIIVKCIDVPAGKSYWWGTSELAKGIEIMGNRNSKIELVEGKYYQCRVRVLDRNEKIFKVSIYKEVDNVGIGTIRGLKNYAREQINSGNMLGEKDN